MVEFFSSDFIKFIDYSEEFSSSQANVELLTIKIVFNKFL